MAISYHMALDIEGCIANTKRYGMKYLKGWTDDDGEGAAPSDVLEFLKERLASGDKFVPMGACDTFDTQKGCPGHPVSLVRKEETSVHPEPGHTPEPPRPRKWFHARVHLSAVIRMAKSSRGDRLLRRRFYNKDGTEVERERWVDVLEARVAAGDLYMTTTKCKNFDPKKGCLGHVSERFRKASADDEGRLVVTPALLLKRRQQLFSLFCNITPTLELLRQDPDGSAVILQQYVADNIRPRFSYATAKSIVEAVNAIATSQIDNGYEVAAEG